MSDCAVTEERGLMWQNFLNACKLGTVIQAYDQVVWQKCGKFSWRRIGASGDYSADSIAWPADVLLEGIE